MVVERFAHFGASGSAGAVAQAVVLLQTVNHSGEPVSVDAGDCPVLVADLGDGWSDRRGGHPSEQAERGGTPLPAREVGGGRHDSAVHGSPGRGFGIGVEELAHPGGEIGACHRDGFVQLGP